MLDLALVARLPRGDGHGDLGPERPEPRERLALDHPGEAAVAGLGADRCPGCPEHEQAGHGCPEDRRSAHRDGRSGDGAPQ